jgi:hypothetical protein
MVHYSWHDATKSLIMLDRENEQPAWKGTFTSFKEAKSCADAFQRLYEQGLAHGRLKALEEMRRTIDHIERGPL